MRRPYPAYKETGLEWLGYVPSHWETTKAKWLFANVSEKNCPDEQLLSATQEYGVVPRDMLEERVVMPMGELVHFKLVQQGDFVISLRSFQGGIEYSDYRGLVSPAYTVLRNRKTIDKTYIKYLMKCFPFISELQTSVTGIREGKNINYKDFAEIIIPIPPLSEQTKIAQYIEEQTAVINQFLTNKRRLIELLEEQKQVVINTAVTQGLDTAVSRKPSGIDWLGDIPAHWQMLRNKYIFTEVSDRSETGEELQLSVHQQLGIIPRSEIGDRPMDESPTAGSKRCQIGDLILNRLKAHLGVFFRTELEGVVSPDYTVFRPKRDVSTKYFEYLFRHPVYISIWNKTVRGIVAGFYRLYTDDFGNVPSVFPPPDEQREIVKFIDKKTAEINAAIDRTQREIELIEEYRTTLIAHTVTGKIDVRLNNPK
ncbi:MAG: restriction endonuclease subunit S [Ardenticatenaceae bacterium]|nr:restriction endonuclease subunit S [Ardenticatenaceae bacterium]